MANLKSTKLVPNKIWCQKFFIGTIGLQKAPKLVPFGTIWRHCDFPFDPTRPPKKQKISLTDNVTILFWIDTIKILSNSTRFLTNLNFVTKCTIFLTKFSKKIKYLVTFSIVSKDFSEVLKTICPTKLT